jgi:predicted alpha-1,6-mannanase (GH76 family)
MEKVDQFGINWSLSSSYYEDLYWLALSAKRKLLQVPVAFPLLVGLS